jgi:hypothetical protein
MQHRDIGTGEIHSPFNWIFDNQSARLAATGFADGDVDKIALQQSDNTLWVLLSTAPTWTQVAGGGASAMPAASAVGQVLISLDGATFTAQQPLFADSGGWLGSDIGEPLLVG